MRYWRVPVKTLGNFLIGLGWVLCVAAAGSAILEARQTDSPFDQVDGAGGSSQGFVPIIAPQIAPQGETVGQAGAPSLRTPTGSANVNTRPTGATPTTPPPTRLAAASASPSLTATPAPIWIPDRIVIPGIKLDAPVVPAKLKDIVYQGKPYQQWVAPDAFAAGWLTTTARLGVPGNTVLSGHHNLDGEVFGHLVDLKVGDLIVMVAGEKKFAYAVALTMILPERFETLDVRLANARWIEPSQDERLTLVTCWPYASNTHRLIIVATPIGLDEAANYEVTPRVTAQAPLDWQLTPAR